MPESLEDFCGETAPDPASDIACAVMNLEWARGGDADEHGDRYGRIQEIADPIIKAALATAVARARREALEEAAKVAEGWLRLYGDRPIKHVSATQYATDAVTDIADGIRALAATPPEARQTETAIKPGEWNALVGPLVARCEVAAAFGQEAVWNAKALTPSAKVLKRMADVLDSLIAAPPAIGNLEGGTVVKKLRIGRSPLTNKIYIGSVGKDPSLWLSDQTDVTTDAVLAVAEHIGVGFVQTFTRKDGGPSLQIEVREVPTEAPATLAQEPRS